MKFLSPGYCDLDGGFAKLPQKATTDVSALYVSNINFFGRIGGFELTLGRIQNLGEVPRASLSQVYRYVSLMKLWHRIARRRFAGEYYPHLHTVIASRLENLSADDIEECQKDSLRDNKNGKGVLLVQRIMSDSDSLLRSSVGSSLPRENITGH